jgi:hypothetical protein
MSDRRDEFLIEMYKQMFNDINRHIMVVWQSVGVLIGAFAIFALVEKNVLSADVASAIVVLLSGWLSAHLADAGYWYNRNLVIIANIERQFLEKGDLQKIHYYFGKHRPDNNMITHLRIQMALGFGLVFIVLLYHFFTRVYPGFTASMANFEPIRGLPYVTLIVAGVYCLRVAAGRNAAYTEFVRNSPGIDIDTGQIAYGAGHGFKKTG